MNQSSVIGGSMMLAFVIFVIYRGDLPCYLQVLGIATAAKCPTALKQSACSGGGTTTGGGTSATATQSSGGSGGTRVGLGITLTNPLCIGRVSIGQICTQTGTGGGGGSGPPPITIGIGGGGGIGV